jgi:hypothetical protein
MALPIRRLTKPEMLTLGAGYALQTRGRTMSGAVTYNIFRHGADPAILCAVPNDKSVPSFVAGPTWSFERAIPVGRKRPARGCVAPLTSAFGQRAKFCFRRS